MKTKEKVEFGDFQTPLDLASQIVLNLNIKDNYESIIEPTCGLGSFLHACLVHGVDVSKIHGWEINPRYVQDANQHLNLISKSRRVFVEQKDFFNIDWKKVKADFKEPVLFIGNPPWVTNSELGRMLSRNLPEKRNFQSLTGLDALTGKSNFDISEWMSMKLLDFISGTHSSLAFLIKTSVARKLFQYSYENKLKLSLINIREINAKKFFDVNVDACLFHVKGGTTQPEIYKCKVFKEITATSPQRTIGIAKGKLIADINSYEMLSHIDKGCEFKWRSGVKHDASNVMEFDVSKGRLMNGFGEYVELPYDYLYPIYKSSNISQPKLAQPTKYALITQKKIRENTSIIKLTSPATWAYLLKHADVLDKRKSSIYKKAPRFSIFGVGDYTFLPWKIVISGLYKNMQFSKIGSCNGKPILVDDTCYMLGLEREDQADFILEMLSSERCKAFMNSIVFLDSKRPITVSLLNRINLEQIAADVGKRDRYKELFESKYQQLTFLEVS